MLESSLYSLSYVVSSYLNGGHDYSRMGNAHPLISPYSVYMTKDHQYIVIGVATNDQFATFERILGLNTGFKSNEMRVKNRKTLDESINQKLQEWSLADLV
jgi:crotonobetainyl-CoA:carnitine CoA-transferase CaiB-like acyl-CoA transferase